MRGCVIVDIKKRPFYFEINGKEGMLVTLKLYMPTMWFITNKEKNNI